MDLEIAKQDVLLKTLSFGILQVPLIQYADIQSGSLGKTIQIFEMEIDFWKEIFFRKPIDTFAVVQFYPKFLFRKIEEVI